MLNINGLLLGKIYYNQLAVCVSAYFFNSDYRVFSYFYLYGFPFHQNKFDFQMSICEPRPERCLRQVESRTSRSSLKMLRTQTPRTTREALYSSPSTGKSQPPVLLLALNGVPPSEMTKSFPGRLQCQRQELEPLLSLQNRPLLASKKFLMD